MKKKLRLISLIMFIASAVFVGAALSDPGLGRVVDIGGFRFGQSSGGPAMRSGLRSWFLCLPLRSL